MNIMAQYAKLCAELGDLTCKADRIMARIAEIKNEISVLDKLAGEVKQPKPEPKSEV